MKLTKNQSGIAPVVVVLLLVLVGIVGFAGYRVYDSQKKTNQSLDNTAKNIETIAKQKNESKIPEGFVEYKDNETGVSFVYPKSWDKKEKSVSVTLLDSYETTYGISGSKIVFDLNKNNSHGTYNWVFKESYEPINKQPVRTVNSVSVYNFGGGDGGDPACAFGKYVFAVRGKAVQVSVPTACERAVGENTYLFAQQEKDVKEFLESIKIN